jgi:uncharacterized membrane protein
VAPIQSRHKPAPCRICGLKKPNMVPLVLIRPAIIAEIQKSRPDFTPQGDICTDDLNQFRFQYVQGLLASEKGELTTLDQDVLESLRQHEPLTSDTEAEFAKKLTFGEALADKMADFGGSWKFILLFSGILIGWILINALALLSRPFDPYPFILLNLVLSCLAAFQAPVIMMSQNRQEAKDRLRAENDYRVNLKAELEIRQIHEKLDHLLSRQWERLVEIQQVQLDLMSEIASVKSRG